MKGAPMREILRWHERNVGRARVRAIGASLRPELATFVDVDAEALGLMPSTWYPAPLGHAILREVFGPSDDETRAVALREASHAAVRGTARGVYRLVLSRLVTPSMLASSIQRLWNLVMDDGERSMVLTTESTIDSRTRSWTGHGADPLLCQLMCETTAALLETMGRRDVRLERLSCVSHGAAECATRYRWGG